MYIGIGFAVIEKEMPKFYGVHLIGVCSKHVKNIHCHFADDDKDGKDNKNDRNDKDDKDGDRQSRQARSRSG